MKKYNLAFVVMFVLSQGVWAEELTDTKKQSIKSLMDVTGAAQMGEMFSQVFVQQITAVLKQTNPDIPEKALDIVAEEVNGVVSAEIVENGRFFQIIYPIYHKYLTQDDIDGLIAFYKTPVGKKMITVMPMLTQESMQAGQQWGLSLGAEIEKRIAKRFKEEGIE